MILGPYRGKPKMERNWSQTPCRVLVHIVKITRKLQPFKIQRIDSVNKFKLLAPSNLCVWAPADSSLNVFTRIFP